MLKKVLIITISHKAKDVRLYYKLAKTLSEKFAVTILHNQTEQSNYDDDIKLLPLGNLKKANFLLQATLQIKLTTPDIVVVVEPILLGLVNPTAKTKFVYDCHEFFDLAQKEKSLNKKKQFIDTFLHRKLEEKFIPKLNACITVNDILTQKYQAMGTHSITIANYPIPSPQRFSQTHEKKYDFIYAGGISPIRGISEIIQATFAIKKIYPSIKVLIMGKEQIYGYRDECLEMINTLGLKSNIELIDAIPYTQVYEYYHKAKCGICLLSPTISRYKYALPIKLLEYLDAGLLVITNDFPMTKQISKSSPGILTANFSAEDLANKMLKIITLPQDIIENHRHFSQDLVQDKYNWNLLKTKVLTLFESLSSKKKKALLVSYFFPPLGGAGVQRPLKLAKYAKESDWNIVVLTVENIVFHSYDQSLLSEIENEIIRADSWDIMSLLHKLSLFKQDNLANKVEKAYFQTDDFKKKLLKSLFFIDEKIGWFIPAVLKGIRQVMKENFSAIIVTIYPPSSLLIALTIAKITNLPLFIDYRDHWTLSSYFDFSCQSSRNAYHNLEKFFLTKSRGIITIGEIMKEELAKNFNISLAKITVSYNGFDESDFIDFDNNILAPSHYLETNKNKNKNKIKIGYIGNMYKHRTSKYFLKAIKELIDEQSITKDEIELNFMGNYYIEEEKVFQESGLTDILQLTPQQEHKIAIKKMLDVDILLLLIATQSGKNVLTGKIFEYLKSNKAILGLVPRGGEAENLLHKLGNPWTCPLEDVTEIKKQLLNIIKFVQNGEQLNFNIAEYSRKKQVKKIFAFIEEKL